MSRKYLDRYAEFRDGSGFKPLPFIKIKKSSSDKRDVYNSDSRLDKISTTYYGSPYFGWLILQANQHLGSMEFDFPDNEILVIPFPLESGIERYINKVKEYKQLNE